VKGTSWTRGLSVTAGGSGVVPLAGAVAVRLLADRVGLTEGLSGALSRRGFTPLATLVTAHSDKEQAAATFKHGYGFHPIGVWCDNTSELLAIMLRPGNAGSNHAGDHIAVLTRAIAQIPAARRNHVLVRADGAGATHQLLNWLTDQGQVRGRGVEYSVGFPTKNAALTSAISRVPKRAWTPALTADGEIREHAEVAEVTGLLDLTGWPEGMRVIVRRERPHPEAQLSLFEAHDGYRYQAFATNTRVGQLGFLEARHRAHACVEDRIRAAKDTGLGRLPSREYTINQAWVQIVAVAADLVAWLQLLALDGDLAKAEPKLLPFKMLHVPARLTRGAGATASASQPTGHGRTKSSSPSGGS
jgi:Transposase DDE domain group 1